MFKELKMAFKTLTQDSEDDHEIDDKIEQSRKELSLASKNTSIMAESLLQEFQDALKDSRRKVKTVGDMLTDALILTNSCGEIETFNLGAVKMFGFAHQVFRDKNITDILDIDIHNTSVKETIGHTKNGNIDVEVTVSELDLTDNNQYMFLVRDITTRKQNEKELQQYRETLENLIEERTHELEIRTEMYRVLSRSAPVGLFRSDINGNLVYINKKWETMTGYNKNDALGSGWLDYLTEECKSRVIEAWNDSQKAKKPFEMVFEMYHKDGSVVRFLGQANFVNGGNIGMVGTLTKLIPQQKND